MTPAFPAIPAGHARFAGTLRSEWTKLRTVRSTRWLLLALVVATVAIGIGVSAAEAKGIAHSTARKADFDPANWSLSILGFTQLLFGILGVLAISGEYTSGTIRSSLAAVPRRLRLLAAKTTIIGLTALLAGELNTFAMFFAGQALLRSARAPHTTLGQPGVARAVVATGIFLTLLSLLGTGCGTIFRRSAAGITAYIVISFLTFLIPPGNKYSPEIMLVNSVTAVRSINAADGFLPPGWVSVTLLACYTVAALLAGAVLFTRRDA